jgi:hypothetical protein
MYKRRARILFVGQGQVSLELACAVLERVASEAMQGRCLCLARQELESETVDWADLLIALDEVACHRLQEAEIHVPYRCWEQPRESATASEYFKQQLRSMLGGMRMLQRTDS